MTHHQNMHNFFSISLYAICLFALSCTKNNSTDIALPTINISTDRITGKAAQQIMVTVTMAAPNGIGKLLISKGLNLVTDSSFGTNGILNADLSNSSNSSAAYVFNYIVDSADIDKLVGFNFKFTDAVGNSAEKDLTLTAQNSAALTVYSYKWQYASRKVVSINFEAIQNCEKDNIYLYRKDSSTILDYGLNACANDSSIIYFKWALSNDETLFTQWYYPKDFPDSSKTEIYSVIAVSNKKLTLEKTEDLSSQGLSDEEKVQYSFNAIPY